MRLTIEEDRKSWRFPRSLKGIYFLEEQKGEGKKCTIINISYNGAGLEFYTMETVCVKSKLFLEIFLPGGKETVTVEGIIQWVKQGRIDCICGIKLTKKLDREKMVILRM